MSEEGRPPAFEHYDADVAAAFIAASEQLGGLPGFLGLRIVEAGPGWMRAEAQVKPELQTPFGNLHGGVMAATCDHLLGCVCYPLMKKGQWAATTEFKLNYLAPISEGRIVAEARVLSITRSTAVVRIDVSNEGRLACAAQGLVLIRDPRPR
jgi:uncharacterized protein (TIGR00369 family)